MANGATYFPRRHVRLGVFLRLALGALGLAELLWPRRLVDFWMGLAARGEQDVELRPWVYTAARVEGVLLLVWVLAGSRRD